MSSFLSSTSRFLYFLNLLGILWRNLEGLRLQVKKYIFLQIQNEDEKTKVVH